MLKLAVRPMQPHELPMVLSNWKRELYACRAPWRSRLNGEDFWDLVNHVIDKITIPSSAIFVGVHPDEPAVPICWVAVRGGIPIYAYAREAIRKDLEMAAVLQRELLELVPIEDNASKWYPEFSPYKELTR